MPVRVCVCVSVCKKRISGRAASPRTSVAAAPRRARGWVVGSQGPRMSPQNCAIGSNSDLIASRQRKVRDVPVPGPATTRPSSSAVRIRGTQNKRQSRAKFGDRQGRLNGGLPAGLSGLRTRDLRPPPPPQRAGAPLDAWSGARERAGERVCVGRGVGGVMNCSREIPLDPGR